MDDTVRDKVNSIIQLVNLEIQAEARKSGKPVDPIAKLARMRERIEAAGLPLPDHLKKS